MKRYCQILNLREDPELIAKYCEAHAHVWPEIQEGIRSVGILDMQIFRRGTTLFMICDTVDSFDWVNDNARLATLPRQAEWEAYVAQFQGCDPAAPSTEKWQLMEKIFELEKP
ncbi:MAG: L-rhamnose mutarotase [Bacteroidales bacterium]|nr:L-rhamnose mutarotase [Bacteroidales bacterium]